MNSEKEQNVKTHQELANSQYSLWKEIEELSQMSEYSSSQVSQNVVSPFVLPFDSSSNSRIGHDELTTSLDLIEFSLEEQQLLNSLDQATMHQTSFLRVETDLDSEEISMKALEFIAPMQNLPPDRENGLRESSKKKSHKKKTEEQK